MKKWRIKKPKQPFSEDDDIVEKLAAINGIDDISRFSKPTYKELHDPYLLKNVEDASNRILKAIHMGEKIVIHVDIDADGICSTAIMYRYLNIFTDNVHYIHSQRSRGHGISNSINDIPDDTDLLIIVDSSSSQTETCEKIKKKGIDIVIIDHHEIEQENLHCILVNPQQEGCAYSNKNPSGSLVVWKVCQVLEDNLGGNYTDNLIDLAGLGLYSDQMSMLEMENRYIVYKALNNIKNMGILEILRVLNKKVVGISATDIGYSVMPFINAAARLDRIELVLEAVISDDIDVVKDRVKQVKKLNETRKETQKNAIQCITPRVDDSKKCIVIVEPSLGKGFNGLIAGDLSNSYQRPVIIFGESNDQPDEYHGSFRSIGFFNFLDYVKTIPEVLFSGGHKLAGGLGIKKENLDSFIKSVNDGLKREKFEQVVTYDLELDSLDINENLISKINEFYRVSGKHFGEAIFLIKDVFVLNKKALGSGDTLKIELCPTSETWFNDDEDLVPSLVAMKFKTDEEFINNTPIKASIDLVGTLNINEFIKYRPRYEVQRTLQVFIDDYRLSQ